MHGNDELTTRINKLEEALQESIDRVETNQESLRESLQASLQQSLQEILKQNEQCVPSMKASLRYSWQIDKNLKSLNHVLIQILRHFCELKNISSRCLNDNGGHDGKHASASTINVSPFKKFVYCPIRSTIVRSTLRCSEMYIFIQFRKHKTVFYMKCVCVGGGAIDNLYKNK